MPASSIHLGVDGNPVPKLRNSERSAFKRCPQRWWWSYREGLVPKGQPSNPLWFGTGIHLCFALWYKPGTVRGVDMNETWESYVDGEIRFIKTQANADDTTEEKVAEYVEAREPGHIMLNGYVEAYGLEEHWDVIAPEQIFAVIIPDDMGDPIVELVGTFDGVYRDLSDGKIKLMEHKTAGQISTKHLPLDDQAGTYWAVATHVLRENDLIRPKERISGITYNFLRKAKPDERPVGPDGFAHNKPTKAHYLEALNPVGEGLDLSKIPLTRLASMAEANGIEVWGDVSKIQPAKNFVREFVPRTAYERKRQIERIADEALSMEAMRTGDLPLYKTPTKDCSMGLRFLRDV